jgi:hypothetical protein
MPRRIPRARANAATDDRLFLGLVFGLMTATMVSGVIAAGTALQTLF